MEVDVAGPAILLGPNIVPIRGGIVGFWLQANGEPGDIEGGDAQEHAVECGLLRRWQPEDGPGPHCDACEDTEGEPGSCSCLFPTLKPFGPAPAEGGRETR